MNQKTKTLARNPLICDIELKEREKLRGFYEAFRAPFRLDIWSYESGISGTIFWMTSRSIFDTYVGIEGELPTAFSSQVTICHDEESALKTVETAMENHILETMRGIKDWLDLEVRLRGQHVD